MKKILFLTALYILLFLFIPKNLLASPLGGYVVNEKSKMCTFDIVGDEDGNVYFGDCVVKDFSTSFSDSNYKEVCESHGYKYTTDYKSFCHGPFVGAFYPITNNYVLYEFLGVGLILLPFIVGAIIAFTIYKFIPLKLKKVFIIVLIVTVFAILYLILTEKIKLVSVTQI